jgi:glycosyltransferase involved in cell wall biosynthesis
MSNNTFKYKPNVLFLASHFTPIYGGAEKNLELLLDNLKQYEFSYVGNSPVIKKIFQNRKLNYYLQNTGFEPVTKLNLLLYPITLLIQLLNLIKNFQIYKKSDLLLIHLPSFVEVLTTIPLISIFFKKKIILIVHLNCPQSIHKNPLLWILKFLWKQKNVQTVFVSKTSFLDWQEKNIRSLNSQIIYNGTEIKKITSNQEQEKNITIHENNIILEKDYFNKNNIKLLKIGFVGRINPEKGLDLIISALKKITKQEPNIIFELDIYSQSKQGEYLQKIQNEIEKLKTFSNLKIYLKGTVENLDEIYADKDLIIFPSFKESFGRVLIESWSYGKPVICSDLAAFKEIHEIAKINLSLIFETGNVEELQNKINHFIKNRFFYEDLDYQKKLVSAVQKNFSTDVFIKNYDNLFQKVIK